MPGPSVPQSGLIFSLDGENDRTDQNMFFSLCFLFFFFGLCRSFYAWENIRGVWTDEEREYHAILLNTPQISSRTVGAEAMLMAGDDGSSVRQTGKLWLTFSRDSLAETLRTGDELVFKGHIRRPKNKGNPEEFELCGIFGRERYIGPCIHRKGALETNPWI